MQWERNNLMWIRATKDFLLFGFASYGALWTLAESFSAFVPDHKPEGLFQYSALILVCVGIGLWRAWPRQSVEIDVPNSDSSLVIKFGDIFKTDGCIAIPVNEFFDSQIGNHVAQSSLHGQLITNLLGGQSAAFDSLVSSALATQPCNVVARSSGNARQYKIGTTATIEINAKKFFLFALTKTDLQTLKASASVHELWDSLAGLWESVRNHSNGHTVALPLVGGGLSGVGLPPRSLLEIIVISYFYYTKKFKIADSITVVLPKNLSTKIDLLSVKNNWSM